MLIIPSYFHLSVDLFHLITHTSSWTFPLELHEPSSPLLWSHIEKGSQITMHNIMIIPFKTA